MKGKPLTTAQVEAVRQTINELKATRDKELPCSESHVCQFCKEVNPIAEVPEFSEFFNDEFSDPLTRAIMEVPELSEVLTGHVKLFMTLGIHLGKKLGVAELMESQHVN